MTSPAAYEDVSLLLRLLADPKAAQERLDAIVKANTDVAKERADSRSDREEASKFRTEGVEARQLAERALANANKVLDEAKLIRDRTDLRSSELEARLAKHVDDRKALDASIAEAAVLKRSLDEREATLAAKIVEIAARQRDLDARFEALKTIAA